MISSIFGKTKPINYIIVLTFLFLLYGFVQFSFSVNTVETIDLVINTFVFGALVACVFLINFITHRNRITGASSFAILFFGLLFMVFPRTLLDFKAVFCSFFILLATRRILSIKSLKGVKLKIFDATLWILVSSLFYNWALIFLLLLFAAIYIYEPKNFRNWLVPLTSAFVFGMITYSILLVYKSQDFLLEHYSFYGKFNKEYILSKVGSIRLLLYVISVIVLAALAFLRSGNLGVGKITTMRLLIFSFVLGFLVFLLSYSNDNSILITFFPAVVFFTNYLESIQKENFKEIFLILSIFIPFLVLVTSIILL